MNVPRKYSVKQWKTACNWLNEQNRKRQHQQEHGRFADRLKITPRRFQAWESLPALKSTLQGIHVTESSDKSPHLSTLKQSSHTLTSAMNTNNGEATYESRATIGCTTKELEAFSIHSVLSNKLENSTSANQDIDNIESMPKPAKHTYSGFRENAEDDTQTCCRSVADIVQSLRKQYPIFYLLPEFDRSKTSDIPRSPFVLYDIGERVRTMEENVSIHFMRSCLLVIVDSCQSFELKVMAMDMCEMFERLVSKMFSERRELSE